MIVTRQRLLAQAALVSTMQSSAASEPNPIWRAVYVDCARRDAAKLALMRQRFVSNQRVNVFPLPVRGRVED